MSEEADPFADDEATEASNVSSVRELAKAFETLGGDRTGTPAHSRRSSARSMATSPLAPPALRSVPPSPVAFDSNRQRHPSAASVRTPVQGHSPSPPRAASKFASVPNTPPPALSSNAIPHSSSAAGRLQVYTDDPLSRSSSPAAAYRASPFGDEHSIASGSASIRLHAEPLEVNEGSTRGEDEDEVASSRYVSDGSSSEDPFGDRFEFTEEEEYRNTRGQSFHTSQLPQGMAYQRSMSVDAAKTIFSPTEAPVRPPLPPRPSSPKIPSRGTTPVPPSLPARRPQLALPQHPLATSTRPQSPQEGKYAGLRTKPERFAYIDIGNANRRPPLLAGKSVKDILPKSSIKLIAVSGKYVCTYHTHVRFWSLETGENVRTVSLGEAKPSSLAFVPSGPGATDAHLWVGLEKGDIWCLDVSTGDTLERKNIHSSAVSHMVRHKGQLWTCDENGGLKHWSPDAQSRISLTSRPQNYRINSRQGFLFVTDWALWTAAGKTLEHHPFDHEGTMSFQKRAEAPPSVGPIACVAANYDPAVVYTGHEDGKIVVWDTKELVKKKIVSTGLYKVLSLLGVGKDHLWAGFSTGRISVYDVSEPASLQDPFTNFHAIKHFVAYHSATVVMLTINDNALFQDGQLQVVSLADSGHIRAWDGYLSGYWQDIQLRQHEASFSSYRDLNVFIGSWNIDSNKPHDLEAKPDDARLFQEWFQTPETPDIVVIGFQEIVDLESAVFIAEDEFTHAKHVNCTMVKTGLGGYHGNKGGLTTRFTLEDSSFCFVNCHLAAHQGQVSARNNDCTHIIKETILEAPPSINPTVFVNGGDGSGILDHEYVFWSGDLNYRIDMPRDKVIEMIQQGDLTPLIRHDQLTMQRLDNPHFALRDFFEGPLQFHPTFKYDRGTDTYDTSEKKRVPAWCDRILWKGGAVQRHYQRHECRISDHRPVSASFVCRVKRIDRDALKTVVAGIESQTKHHLQAALQQHVQWFSY